ncbi:MAG: WYL domain-containing protein [Verrucomicrobiota bacterium]
MVKKVQKKSEKRTRPPLARMLRVHEALQTGEYPNCSGLSKKLEVSSKTIQRDVDFMRDQLGLPIEYDPEQYGFFYTEEVREFPSVQVSEGELIALFVAQKALNQYQGTSFERPLAAAFRKLTDGLKDEVTIALKDWDSVFSFRSVGPSVTDLKQFEQISEAVRQHREIEFDYRKLTSRAYEERRCHPYHLTCVDHQWYLFGYDVNRENIRTFVLTRMRGLQVLEATFTPPEEFSAAAYLEQSFGIFSSEKEHEIVIRFDGFASQLVRERIWHTSQKLTELEDGTVKLELKLGSLPEIERWILSWGEHARAIAPSELVASIKAKGEKMLAQYSTDRMGQAV